jgi:hypothetical protein
MISSLATPGHDFLSMHCHSLHGAPRFAYLLYLYLGKHILYPRVHGPPHPPFASRHQHRHSTKYYLSPHMTDTNTLHRRAPSLPTNYHRR